MSVQFITYFSLHKKDARRYFQRQNKKPTSSHSSSYVLLLEQHSRATPQLQKPGEKSPVAEAAQSQHNLSSMASPFRKASVKASFLTELGAIGNWSLQFKVEWHWLLCKNYLHSGVLQDAGDAMSHLSSNFLTDCIPHVLAFRISKQNLAKWGKGTSNYLF